MPSIVILLLNVLLLTVALVAGFVLFLWVAGALALAVIYLLIRQKFTGKPPFVNVYTFRQTKHSEESPIIEAEYREINEK